MKTGKTNSNFTSRATAIAGLAALLFAPAAEAHDVHEAHVEAHEAEAHYAREGHVSPTATHDAVRPLIRAFRESGDDAHLDAAWALIEPDLEAHDVDTATLVDAAMVAQSRHDFELALELVDRALAKRPHLDSAWLLRASIELVRGRIDSALDACRKLRRVAAMTAVTCRSRVAIAQGRNETALRQMTAVLAHVRRDDAYADGLAWSFSVAGDAAADLDTKLAASLYGNSLDLAESTQVRSALVDVLLRADRLDDAKAALASGSAALPLTVRRMIVAKRENRDAEIAHEIARADRRFRHWIAHEDWLHAREMARFYLDVLPRPALAQQLARVNLAQQREAEDLLLAARTRGCSSCGG
ncbi:MAG: hypothetical protein AAGE85_06990 [Pseudomonadota bacterium]